MPEFICGFCYKNKFSVSSEDNESNLRCDECNAIKEDFNKTHYRCTKCNRITGFSRPDNYHWTMKLKYCVDCETGTRKCTSCKNTQQFSLPEIFSDIETDKCFKHEGKDGPIAKLVESIEQPIQKFYVERQRRIIKEMNEWIDHECDICESTLFLQKKNKMIDNICNRCRDMISKIHNNNYEGYETWPNHYLKVVYLNNQKKIFKVLKWITPDMVNLDGSLNDLSTKVLKLYNHPSYWDSYSESKCVKKASVKQIVKLESPQSQQIRTTTITYTVSDSTRDHE